MRLSLFHYSAGVETGPGNRAVYDLGRNEAHFGAAAVEGPALVWELLEEERAGTVLSAPVAPGPGWLLRCDRIDFPPGGVAYLHTHPGPGIRCLLAGRIRIDTEGGSASYGPLQAWFERGPDPVYAAASDEEETAFVRVLLLPGEWEGKRTIRYVHPEDAEKPKLQRATVFFDQPLEQ